MLNYFLTIYSPKESGGFSRHSWPQILRSTYRSTRQSTSSLHDTYTDMCVVRYCIRYIYMRSLTSAYACSRVLRWLIIVRGITKQYEYLWQSDSFDNYFYVAVRINDMHILLFFSCISCNNKSFCCSLNIYSYNDEIVFPYDQNWLFSNSLSRSNMYNLEYDLLTTNRVYRSQRRL